MNYPRDTYIKYNVFCKTVVLETKAMLDVANLGFTWGTVLIIIAKLLGVGIPIFVGVSILTSAGALTYFGSIGALIAANPVMAGILLGATGMGLFQIFRLIWKKNTY